MSVFKTPTEEDLRFEKHQLASQLPFGLEETRRRAAAYQLCEQGHYDAVRRIEAIEWLLGERD